MPELTIVNGYKLSTDEVFQIRPEFYVHQIRITLKASIANILITGNIALKCIKFWYNVKIRNSC